MKSKITVIGQFTPSQLDSIIISTELRDWLAERGIVPRERQIGARTPKDTINACRSTPVLMDWHRDGAGPDPTDPNVIPSVKRLLVWSNGTPTELKTIDGTIHKMNSWDVVLFDNVNVWHRSPPAEAGRWFVGLTDPIIQHGCN